MVNYIVYDELANNRICAAGIFHFFHCVVSF